MPPLLQNPAAPDPAPVMQLRKASEDASCGLLAISAFSGVLYEDVVRVATLIFPLHGGRGGMTVPEMRKLLKELGFPVRKRKLPPDALDDLHGIILFRHHAAVIRNGLLFEPDLSVWEISDWMAAHPKDPYEGVLLPVKQRAV